MCGCGAFSERGFYILVINKGTASSWVGIYITARESFFFPGVRILGANESTTCLHVADSR